MRPWRCALDALEKKAMDGVKSRGRRGRFLPYA